MKESIEFSTTPRGVVLWRTPDMASPQELKMSDSNLLSFMYEMIQSRYADAFKKLAELYHSIKFNNTLFRYKVVSRFIRCNFGKDDLLQWDVDSDGNFKFEEVQCPLRCTGDCPFDGVICKPKYTSELSTREIEILSLIARGLESSEIAERLCLSANTVGRHRYNITVKTNCHSTAELIIFYFNHFTI